MRQIHNPKGEADHAGRHGNVRRKIHFSYQFSRLRRVRRAVIRSYYSEMLTMSYQDELIDFVARTRALNTSRFAKASPQRPFRQE